MRAMLCLLAAAALSLAGCDGSPSGSDSGPEGSLSFTYRGAASGSFKASGELKLAAGTAPQPSTGAAAFMPDSTLAVVAFRETGSGRGDGFSLLLGTVKSTGTLTLNLLGCQQQSPGACRIGFFAPDISAAELAATPDPAALLGKTYVLVLGEVKVTSISATRVKGTFSGTAFLANQQSLSGLLQISDGRFDVPVQGR